MYSPADLLFPMPEENVMAIARGGFARQVLALVCQEEHFAEGNMFLEKVLTAAGLNLEQDVALASVEPGSAVSLFPFPQHKRPQVVLVFGIEPKDLGLRLESALYVPTDFYGTVFLFAHKLSELQPDTGKKGQLWRALQQIFLK
ncbi:MAG: hypothetical protein IT270_03600 [Saprospiraceae bacterium]|nr:hypothetical protein [Saprospiraceae bacterium]